MKHLMIKYFLLFFFVFFNTFTFAQNTNNTLFYKVIGISDGDTFTVLHPLTKQSLVVRMDAIDAPEKGMPYWKKSKQFLAQMIFGKMVYLKNQSKDLHQRIIARTFLSNGTDVSAEMIKAGYAWHYKKFNMEPLLAQYENNARRLKMGLWRDPKPYHPAYIRQLHRKGISTKNWFQRSVK